MSSDSAVRSAIASAIPLLVGLAVVVVAGPVWAAPGAPGRAGVGPAAPAKPSSTSTSPSTSPTPFTSTVTEPAPAGVRQRVAVVRVDFEGNVAEAARELFVGRLVEGLAAAQFEVFSGAAVSQKLTGAGRLGSCRDGGCYPAVAQALGVTYLVAVRVTETSKNYELSLELINGRTGGAIGTNRERCEICGVDEAGEKMAMAASALRTRLEAVTRTPARFIIQSRPAGASLAVDGVAVGRTPIDRELVGGLHKLELSAPGYDSLARTVTAVSGVDETLDLELVRLPMKFPFRKAGWAAVAAGAVALVVGIWAMSVDGDELTCASGELDDRGHCPRVRSTRALGATLIGLGGATATLGGAWLYIAGGTPWVAPPQEAGGAAGVDRAANLPSARGGRIMIGGKF